MIGLIILKFVLSTYIVGYYVTISYNNNSKLIFKITDILATIILIATIIYSVVNFDIWVLLGIVTGFGVAIKLIFETKEKNKTILCTSEKEIIDINREISKLNKYANEIADGNYTTDFINGGYKYSDNVRYLPGLLSRLKNKIYYERYTSDRKKLLSKKEKDFSFDDCMNYFDYVWHLEASLAVGTVKKQIESGKYIKVLKKFINYLENKKEF